MSVGGFALLQCAALVIALVAIAIALWALDSHPD